SSPTRGTSTRHTCGNERAGSGSTSSGSRRIGVPTRSPRESSAISGRGSGRVWSARRRFLSTGGRTRGCRASSCSSDYAGERLPDVLLLERDLPVGEAERYEPCRGVRLIPEPVTVLLGRSAVIAQAVRLDDEPDILHDLGPVEIDLEAVDVYLRQRLRQPGATCYRKEQALDVGVREDKGERVEQLAKGR